jgi:pyruvate carboxylase
MVLLGLNNMISQMTNIVNTGMKMKKRNKGFAISVILCSVLVVFMITDSAALIAVTYAQTVVPIPKHTFAYGTGAKKGLEAAKAGVYDVGTACASFAGNDLEHCIAGYYDAVAGYHDTVLAANTISKYHNGTNK